MSLELRIPRRLEVRTFVDAVAYRFACGQSVLRIRRLYRVRKVDVEQALRLYLGRRVGK